MQAPRASSASAPVERVETVELVEDDPALVALCEALAWRAVPHDADWCLIDAVDEGAQGLPARRLAVAWPGGNAGMDRRADRSAFTHALGRFPFVVGEGGAPWDVLTTTTAKLAAEADGEGDLDRAALWRAFGPGAVWRATVRSQVGRPLGFVTLVRGADRPVAGAAEAVRRLAAAAAWALDGAAVRRRAEAARRGARAALDRTLRLQSLTQALSAARSREELVEVAVEQGLQALGAAAGSMALLDERTMRLKVRAVGYAPGLAEAWRDVALEERFPLSDAVREGDPIFLRDAGERLARYPHLAELVRRNGSGAMAALPVWLDGRPIGALGLNFDAPRDFDESDRAFVNTLARLCGQAIERVRHLEAEQHARHRLELVAEAGRRLSSTLDYEQTLQNVATLMLPHLGDFCVFDLREESGELRRIARAREPDVQALLERTPWVLEAELGSGETRIFPEVDEALLRELSSSPAEFETLRGLDFNSLLIVPVSLGGERVGALTMAYAQSGRRHGPEERGLAEELARRAGVAVQHARLMRETRRAVSLRDEFLSIAGHELNTPLTTLKLQLTALERHGGVGGPAVTKVQGAHRQVDRLTRLVRSLLDLSRFETGRLMLDLQEVDLGALLRDVVDRQLEHPQLAATVTVGAPPQVVLRGDPLRLDQLFGNLVSNAVKYGGGQPVEVRVGLEADAVQVEVADNGIGIPAGDHERVFDRFQRAVSAQHYGGFGVGLWIVREVAHAHGGQITLDSEPGRGTTFTVRLPLHGPGGDRPA